MARPFSFPDPNDRSRNDPGIIVASSQVLGLYNQDNEEGDEMQKVTKKVQDWFIERSRGEGWDEAEFSGNQCILENQFQPVK